MLAALEADSWNDAGLRPPARRSGLALGLLEGELVKRSGKNWKRALHDNLVAGKEVIEVKIPKVHQDVMPNDEQCKFTSKQQQLTAFWKFTVEKILFAKAAERIMQDNSRKTA
ncbi:hypothetical protein Y1Q_0001461 [Alligator mississippiensis]|uniref:Uncharacterized protein n=1 Tax=Alligator mississippiensis TaxID=8496 RepID=A0A151M9K0_ALLMI|nr:hypothetical protein Y1Q_0001461 [Alligator mississippiensis]